MMPTSVPLLTKPDRVHDSRRRCSIRWLVLMCGTALLTPPSQRPQRKNLLLQNEIKRLKEELDTSRTFTLIWLVTTLLFGSISYAWFLDWLGS